MKVEDIVELHELAARYGDVMDSGDWAQLARIFTDDAIFDLTDIGDGELRGLVAIQRHMIHARHPVAHLITNVYLNDGEPPHLRSRVLGVLGDRRVGTGTYDDEVRLTPEGWRISRRTFVMTNPARSTVTPTSP